MKSCGEVQSVIMIALLCNSFRLMTHENFRRLDLKSSENSSYVIYVYAVTSISRRHEYVRYHMFFGIKFRSTSWTRTFWRAEKTIALRTKRRSEPILLDRTNRTKQPMPWDDSPLMKTQTFWLYLLLTLERS
jgi:hypothetical protein